MKKVLVFDGIAQVAIDYLKSNHIEVISNQQKNDDDFLANQDLNGIILMMHPVDKHILSQLPDLKIVTCYTAAYNKVQ